MLSVVFFVIGKSNDAVHLQGVVHNSPVCHGKGDLVCGVCICHGTNVGRHCECDAPGLSTVALDAKCKR